jgi:hypothetical protein
MKSLNVSTAIFIARPLRLALFALLLVVMGTSIACAQEPPAPATDAPAEPPTYLEMRRSKDLRTRTTAERYLSLVKTQEWASDKGTKILAKYVSHTDDLSSVTLSVVRGSGAARTVKEVTVPTNRLDRRGQTRVKQIAIMKKLLDEMAAAAAAGPADPNQPGGDTMADAGMPMMDERGVEPRRRPIRQPAPPRPVPPELETPPPAPASAPATVEPPIPDDSGDDPLGFGELPSNPQPASSEAMVAPQFPVAAAPPAAAPPGAAPPGAAFPELGRERPAATDRIAWRTDYEAFRANIQVDSTLDIPQVKTGAIKELEAALEEVKKEEADGDVGEEELAERARKFAAVGEFRWEATLTNASVSEDDWTAQLDLPPLPEPLSLNLFLSKENPGNWQRFKAGDRVRFIGRFVDYDPAVGDLVVEIRVID